jgi:hypothetical protein
MFSLRKYVLRGYTTIWLASYLALLEERDTLIMKIRCF